jgi:hypothetical protein
MELDSTAMTPPDPEAGPEAGGTTIDRTVPVPDPARASLVSHWQDTMQTAREYWEKIAFKKMREDMAFVAGRQWPGQKGMGDKLVDETNERYVANITIRHIKQATSSIYGKNPKIVARQKERLLSKLWDGSMQSLEMAMAGMGVGDPNQTAIFMDAVQALETRRMNTKIAKTVELLFLHEIQEQPLSFKSQMKALVRRTLTCGVGYMKLGFQRVMEMQARPDLSIPDATGKLATVEQLSADLADGVLVDSAPQAEQLRLAVAAMSQETEVLVREGMILEFPSSMAIIPDPKVKQLRGFVGADYVGEEYMLTADQIKRIYNKDITFASSTARRYRRDTFGEYKVSENNTQSDKPANEDCYRVYEIYNKVDGLVYVICEGYGDFLRDPGAPDVWLERFWPWFTLMFNEIDDEECVIPPSDVRLMRDMQMELNRSRQGLREHRRANRPRTYVRSGALETEDLDKIENCEANSVIQLNGMQPGEEIDNVLMVPRTNPITAELYDTGPAFEDIQRVVGVQEANLGGTSGATATEVGVAEGSRTTGNASTVDDLDEFLTEFARAAGQLLLRETSEQTVKQVVGPGAVWPVLSKDEVAREIYLDIEAASTGRPNRAQEIQAAQQLFPLLMQVPGITPEWLAKELTKRLDDRIDITDAFASGLPSVMMMNSQKQIAPAGGDDPNAQGGKGAANAEDPKASRMNAAPTGPQTPTPMDAAAA